MPDSLEHLEAKVESLRSAVSKLTAVVTLLMFVTHAAEGRIDALDNLGSFDNDPMVSEFSEAMDGIL